MRGSKVVMVVAVGCCAAVLVAAARQPGRAEGIARSAIEGMRQTEMSLVRTEFAKVGEITGEGDGALTIAATILRASSDRLVTSKHAFGVSLQVGRYAVTLDAAQAQRLLDVLARLETARAEQPGEAFESATVSFLDSSGLRFQANTSGEYSHVFVSLEDSTVRLASFEPLRGLLSTALDKVNNLRKP